MKILITGATGFIGEALTKSLIKEGNEVFILVRSKSLQKAYNKFENTNVKIIEGDLSLNEIIQNQDHFQLITNSIELIIHLGAVYDLAASLAETYTHNVIGTQNIIHLAKKCKKLTHFHYVSSYAVSGTSDQYFGEDDLSTKTTYTDHYSRTKMQAELLVRNALLKDVKIRVYRPGIVIGNSQDGKMPKVDGPYYFLRILKNLKHYLPGLKFGILPISCHKHSTLPLIPVDILVSWLTEMIKRPTPHQVRGYHLLPDQNIFITKFVEDCISKMGIKLKVIRVGVPQLYAKFLPLLNIPEELVPYMMNKTKYSKKNIKEDYPHLIGPRYETYLDQIISGTEELFS